MFYTLLGTDEMTTDEEFLKIAQECIGFPDVIAPANIQVFAFDAPQILTLCREIERRTLERAEKQKAHCPAPKWNRND